MSRGRRGGCLSVPEGTLDIQCLSSRAAQTARDLTTFAGAFELREILRFAQDDKAKNCGIAKRDYQGRYPLTHSSFDLRRSFDIRHSSFVIAALAESYAAGLSSPRRFNNGST